MVENEPRFYDYVKRLIPNDKLKMYYESGMMSLETMKKYETYKENIRKGIEKLANMTKSANDLIFQEKDKVLFSLNKNKNSA
jgi:membrane-bound lytic murein transglycosylase MltF